MKKENSIHFGIRVEELENYINSRIMEARSKLLQSTDLAVHQGLKDTAVLEHEASTEIEVLKSHVHKTLNPEIQQLAEEISQSNFGVLCTQAADEETILNQKINNVEVDLKRTTLTYHWPSYYKVIVGIVALSSIDALMNYSSFQVISNYLVVAIILSIATALGLAYSSHTIGKRMQKAKTMKEKLIWLSIGIIGGAIVFYCLGMLRQIYVRDETSISNSPFIWMLLNTFFYGIAILLAYSKLPTIAQEQEKQFKEEKTKELELVKKEKATLLEKLNAEEIRFNELRQRIESFRVYRDELLGKLDSEKDHMIATCIREFTIKSGTRSKGPLQIQNSQ